MEQNFGNHSRIVPLFHYFVLPVLGINFVWSIVHAIRNFSPSALLGVAVAAALALGFLYSRVFALTVQDRVIRLEMRLRLQELLSADLRPRIHEFTAGQLVSMRFAADAELPALARKVLDEKIADRKAIKKLIQNWQADMLRA
jgi:uncharacterized membrane protein YciS (DUF1049 family)